MNPERKTQERIDSLEDRVKKLEDILLSSSVDARAPKKEKKVSAKEFLMTKNIKADTKKVLALSYFLEHTEGLESFNVNDLEAVFRAAKEKLPANMNDAVNKNIAAGFLMDAASKKDAKKAWCLTSTGEKYVEGELNK
jgi:hypothetical protein